MAYAPFAEALVCPAYSVCPFSPRSAVGKSSTSATACRFEAEAPSDAVYCFRQIVLNGAEADLAGMETDLDSRPT
jgi:hypothetical protein